MTTVESFSTIDSGKDWLSRKEVLQVVKDGETMLNAQQWLSQRQEFSENIGIFSERNLEFRVCFIGKLCM